MKWRTVALLLVLGALLLVRPVVAKTANDGKGPDANDRWKSTKSCSMTGTVVGVYGWEYNCQPLGEVKHGQDAIATAVVQNTGDFDFVVGKVKVTLPEGFEVITEPTTSVTVAPGDIHEIEVGYHVGEDAPLGDFQMEIETTVDATP